MTMYFEVEAKTNEGVAVNELVEAESVDQAVSMLAERGWSILSIRVVDDQVVEARKRKSRLDQRLQQMDQRRQEWASVLRELLGEIPDGRMKQRARQHVIQLEQLSASDLIESPHSSQILGLLAYPIDGPDASPALGRFVNRMSQEVDGQARRSQALWYPLTLSILTLVLIVVLAVFVAPIFRSMFEDFGITLPAPTLLTLWLSDQLTANLWRTLIIVPGGLALTVAVVWWWRRRALTNRVMGSWVAGSVGNLTAMSSLTGILAELLEVGTPIPQALRVAGGGCGHAMYHRLAEECANRCATNEEAQSVITQQEWLPPLVRSAIGTDSGTSPNIPLLRELSVLYLERTDYRTNWFASAMPSLAIVLLGLTVGFMTISLFMPLVSLVSSLA